MFPILMIFNVSHPAYLTYYICALIGIWLHLIYKKFSTVKRQATIEAIDSDSSASKGSRRGARAKANEVG